MTASAIIYQGPSMLDGAPIVVVATGLSQRASRNSKTGSLIQTWILRADISPVDAIHSGADASICGTCPHRGTVVDGRNVGRSCYVTIFQAPLVVYKAFRAGKYEHVQGARDLADLGKGKRIRVGAYGDPAAVPFAIWQAFLSRAEASTGYTHSWRVSPALKAYCMASVDTLADYEEAKAAGWRTFRVRRSADPLQAREIVCPASKEAGHKTDCASCVACGGHDAKARVDISIIAHGAAGKINAYTARIAA